MGNESKYGNMDRRIPIRTQPVSVRNELDKCYTGRDPVDSRDKFELDAFASAQERLADEDRAYISRQVRKVSIKYKTAGCGLAIKNFSTQGMIELLAKLGIFLNAADYKGRGR